MELHARRELHGGAGHHTLVVGEDGGGNGAYPLILMCVGVFFVVLVLMCLFLGCSLVSVVCLVVELLEE